MRITAAEFLKKKKTASLPKEQKLPQPFRVAVYNYKGGVGKTTTTTIELSSMLAHLGWSVLMVDADPQCNLTYGFLARRDEFESKEEEESPPSTIGTPPPSSQLPFIELPNCYQSFHLPRGILATGDHFLVWNQISSHCYAKDVEFQRLVQLFVKKSITTQFSVRLKKTTFFCFQDRAGCLNLMSLGGHSYSNVRDFSFIHLLYFFFFNTNNTHTHIPNTASWERNFQHDNWDNHQSIWHWCCCDWSPSKFRSSFKHHFNVLWLWVTFSSFSFSSFFSQQQQHIFHLQSFFQLHFLMDWQHALLKVSIALYFHIGLNNYVQCQVWGFQMKTKKHLCNMDTIQNIFHSNQNHQEFCRLWFQMFQSV